MNGSLNPKGQATTYYFQYGTTTGYRLQTRPVDAGCGTATEAVPAVFGALTPKTTYHYRLVAEDASGPRTVQIILSRVGPAQAHVAFVGRIGFVSPGGSSA